MGVSLHVPDSTPLEEPQLGGPLVDALVGTLLLDRFRVLEPVGVGGMAMVFLAEHVTLNKKCAVKVLLPEHSSKPVLVERFLQEARAASMLNHENVVEITDYGHAPNGSAFFIMELLEGEDLADTLARERRLPWPRVQAIVVQICRALAAAHARGIVHRDMKPENVFLIRRHGVEEFVKVLDFGIAKILGAISGRSLTKTGVVVGTPEYMSPEQGESLEVDARADIYSLGVIMYEMLTGRVPFEAPTFAKLLTKHLYEPPPAPTQVAPELDISPQVEAIILKALQKDRDFRFQTVGELMRALEAVGSDTAPVEVVAEHRVAPQIRGITTSYAEVAASASAPATNWRLIGVGVGALVAGIAVTALLLGRGQQTPADDDVDPDQITAAPPVQTEPELEPAQPSTITVTLTTNVDAEIVDASTGELLGRTNAAGLSLARSEAPRAVILRAAGYEELPLSLTLLADLEQAHELVAAPKKKSKKKKTKKNTKKGGDPFSLLPVGH